MSRDLPERWVERLNKHLREKYGAERSGLSAYDFRTQQTLKINFPDGSFAFFRYAFYLSDRELNEVAVFTEHCGYHVFPLYGTVLELLETMRIDDDAE